MRAELAEIRRFIIHYQLHKDTTCLMALASFLVGFSVWAAPLASAVGGR